MRKGRRQSVIHTGALLMWIGVASAVASSPAGAATPPPQTSTAAINPGTISSDTIESNTIESDAIASGIQPAPDGMVYVPAGVYEPLYKNEGEIPVGGFFLDVTPVTNAEFLEFVRANPRWRRSQALKLFTDDHYLEQWAGDLELGDYGKLVADGPVTNVSWFAARAYAKWKGKRLPTLPEWEMAAAASATSARGKDDPAHYQRILQWYSKPTRFPLSAVRSVDLDFHGVRGLHGLVWEWVSDFNTALVTGESRADAGLERNLFCGAGAAGASDFRDYAAFMRYAFRSSLDARYAVPNLGFRCARSAATKEKS